MPNTSEMTLFADTNRGFTSHEHLADVELIHMNGRVYDYNLGRFMSVDPFIQSPTSTQSINPYSYIMNNPMARTDPTGYVSTKEEIEEINHGETAKKDNEEKVETTNGQKNERRTARRDYRTANKVGSPSRVNRAINQVVSWAKAVKKETANLRESGTAGDIAVDFSGIESAADSVIAAAEGNYGKALLSAGGLLLGKVKAAGKVLDNVSDALAKPSELFGRQTKSEFSGSQIRRIRKNIKENGYDSSQPIDVAIVNGRKIIIDGHHRARAAGAAKVDKVPIRVHKVSDSKAKQLEQQAAEAAHSLGLSNRW